MMLLPVRVFKQGPLQSAACAIEGAAVALLENPLPDVQTLSPLNVMLFSFVTYTNLTLGG